MFLKHFYIFQTSPASHRSGRNVCSENNCPFFDPFSRCCVSSCSGLYTSEIPYGVAWCQKFCLEMKPDEWCMTYVKVDPGFPDCMFVKCPHHETTATNGTILVQSVEIGIHWWSDQICWPRDTSQIISS